MLTYGSLFSGIGGLDLGMERAGFVCRWQVEIDPFCRAVLAKHWPEVPRFGDIHDVGAHNLAAVDVICAGFPCPPVSLAGKQLGARDDRWLWPETARVIDALRPRAVVLENVPGLLTANGETFRCVCSGPNRWRGMDRGFGQNWTDQSSAPLSGISASRDGDTGAADPDGVAAPLRRLVEVEPFEVERSEFDGGVAGLRRVSGLCAAAAASVSQNENGTSGSADCDRLGYIAGEEREWAMAVERSAYHALGNDRAPIERVEREGPATAGPSRVCGACRGSLGDEDGGSLRGTMGDVLWSLAECGYDAEWFGLRASDVGAPHRRRRVFVVAYPVAVAEQFDQQRQRSGEAEHREIAAAAGDGRVGYAADERQQRRAHLRWQARHRPEYAGDLVADAECAGRGERGAAHDDDGRDAPRHDADGCGARRVDDADTSRSRDAGEGHTWRAGDAGRDAAAGAGHAAGLAHTASARLEGHESEAVAPRRRLDHGPTGGDARDLADAARLRGAEWDGAADVDAARYGSAWLGWPARPGDLQAWWEPARVLRRAESGVGLDSDGLPAGLVRHRRRALAALGNAVVPQQAAVVAHLVRRRLTEEDER